MPWFHLSGVSAALVPLVWIVRIATGTERVALVPLVGSLLRLLLRDSLSFCLLLRDDSFLLLRDDSFLLLALEDGLLPSAPRRENLLLCRRLGGLGGGERRGDLLLLKIDARHAHRGGSLAGATESRRAVTGAPFCLLAFFSMRAMSGSGPAAIRPEVLTKAEG